MNQKYFEVQYLLSMREKNKNKTRIEINILRKRTGILKNNI